MAKRLVVINQLRPKISSQGVVNLEEMAARVAKNTTFNPEEIYGILRLYTQEVNAALQAGETVKVDGLLSVAPNMKVGGAVNMSLRGDREAVAGLNNPLLWTADKVANRANMTKSADELVAQWDEEHPDDPVTD
ncbi:MAG: hypothetical protein SVX38_11140 [Chloroflexota bacterium]|nr:hypothetical protein [Chloroflexota bacterium]